MPLDASRLAVAIRAALLADATSKAVDNAALTALCQAIAGAVIAEITANATIVPALLVAPPGGGPVTGTGGIT
jgi:cation transporter-like permease